MKTMRVIVLALGCVMLSCGGKQEKQPSIESKNFAVERDAFFSSFRNTPDELSLNLVPGLATFDAHLLNDPALVYQYANRDIKAASNLGIYLADMHYCILYQESEAVKKYFDAAYELSKAIGIEKNILDFLSKRYAENIARHDSVSRVMQQLLEQSTVGLQGTDRERLAGVAMAAYQIENLHLVLTALETFPDDLSEDQRKSQRILLAYVLAQQGKFEITYNFVKSFSDPLDPDKNPNYPFFDNALRELISSYRQLMKEQSGALEDSKLELKDLREKVNTIRTKIVSTQ